MLQKSSTSNISVRLNFLLIIYLVLWSWKNAHDFMYHSFHKNVKQHNIANNKDCTSN